MTHIAVLRGDGIGPEIVDAAIKVLDHTAQKFGIELSYRDGLFGGAAIDATGTPFPDDTKALVQDVDAVILGAVGGPKWDDQPRENRPETALLAARKLLGLYCNIRPIRFYSFLQDRVVFKEGFLDDVDIMVFRELTGGIYFGEKKRDGDHAYDVLSYHKDEMVRIIRDAFQMAARRPKKHLTSIDKANVLETSRMWRETVNEVATEFPEVTVAHMYVDNAAMQMIVHPQQFDVIVTENMFGDIISDESAALAGSLGMLSSVSLGGSINLYEPAHGSAPDIAGQGIANPVATILSMAQLLRFSCGHEDAAKAIETAVDAVLAADCKTADLAGPNSTVLSTDGMAERIMQEI